MNKIIELLVISGWNPNKQGGAGVDYKYLSTDGYVTKPTDSIPNVHFEPRLKNSGLFAQSMFSEGRTSGGSSGSHGVIDAINTDGYLDDVADWGLAGYPFYIYSGLITDSFDNFALLMSGVMEQPPFDWNEVSFVFKDLTSKFKVPIAKSYYLGNNALPDGVEGVEDIKDKPKPQCFGTVFNISPILVNTSRLIYQVNDGGVDSISVRDNGAFLTYESDVGTVADLITAGVTAGKFKTCTNYGYFKLGSSPAGTITADVIQDPSDYIGSMTGRIAGSVLESNGVITQSIYDLNSAIPVPSARFGVYATSETILDILDKLASAGFWWGFDNNSKFWMGLFNAPSAGSPICVFDRSNILTLEKVQSEDTNRGIPVWKVNCKFKKNHTPQTTLAGSVAIGSYEKEWLDSIHEDVTIKTKYPLAAELVIETPFRDYDDAHDEAERQFLLRSVRRDRLKITVSLDEDAIKFPDEGFWDAEAVTQIPFNLNNQGITEAAGFVYVTGGGAALNRYDYVFRLDLNNPTNDWTNLPAFPITRYSHSIVEHNGFLYVAGGIVTNTPEPTPTLIRFNLSNLSGTWEEATITDMPSLGREGHRSIVHNGFLYVIGGQSIDSTHTDIWRLDLSNLLGAWETNTVTPLNEDTVRFGCVLLNNYLYVIGGFDIYGTPIMTTMRLNLSSPLSAWEILSDLPTDMTVKSATLIGNVIYATGNATGTVLTLDTDNLTSGWNTTNIATIPGNLSGTLIGYNDSVFLFAVFDLYDVAEAGSYVLRTNENKSDVAVKLSLGNLVSVKVPRYGYDAGRNMRVIGIESDYSDKKITFDLWG